MSYPPPPENPEGQPGGDPAGGNAPGGPTPPGDYPQPVYPPPPPAAPYGYAGQQYGVPGYGAPQTSQKAIWALVLGVVSLFCCGLVTGIVAIVLGKQAGDEINRSGGMLTGAGMAKAGMILGIIGLGVSVLLIVLFAATGNFSGEFNFDQG